MIPKIIHFCWLSGEEYPDSIKKCIDSWHNNLSDYEIWLWDTERFDISSNVWVREAFEARKYAFAADYIRLFALYHYGGIYLDSDIFVYKSFDDLLNLPYFIGEDRVHCFEPAIIGAEKECIWIQNVMSIYDDRHFIKNDGTYDLYGLPRVFHDVLKPLYMFRLMTDKDDFKDKIELINIFPYDFFNSRDFVGVKQYLRSYCSHNYLGTWMDGQSTWKHHIKRYIPRPWLNLLYGILYRYRDRQLLHSIQIIYYE